MYVWYHAYKSDYRVIRNNPNNPNNPNYVPKSPLSESLILLTLFLYDSPLTLRSLSELSGLFGWLFGLLWLNEGSSIEFLLTVDARLIWKLLNPEKDFLRGRGILWLSEGEREVWLGLLGLYIWTNLGENHDNSLVIGWVLDLISIPSYLWVCI